MGNFNTESDPNKKIIIAMMMGAACKYSAGKTQAQVLTNIAGVVGANIESVPVNKMENKMRETSEDIKQLREMIEQRLTKIEQGQAGVNNQPLVPQVPAPRPKY